MNKGNIIGTMENPKSQYKSIGQIILQDRAQLQGKPKAETRRDQGDIFQFDNLNCFV